MFNCVEKRPIECESADIEAFCNLVKKGDEVDQDGLEARVRNALLLAFGTLGDQLVAVGGIKRPNPDYRARVFRKSGSKLDPKDFVVELGWVMVDKEFRRRGFGRRVMDVLVGAIAEGNTYTTSRAKNSNMHALLVAYGFDLLGKPWRSERGSYDLVLHAKKR